MDPVFCTKARLQSHSDQGDTVHRFTTFLSQCHPVKHGASEPQTKPQDLIRVSRSCASSISHVAVVSLQEQLSLCVQQPDVTNILVNYSHDCLVGADCRHSLDKVVNVKQLNRPASVLSCIVTWAIYLGVIVVCHYVKPGWDDGCLSCRGG